MRRLLEQLIRDSVVTPEQMAAAIATAGERRAERELLATGRVRDEDVARAAAKITGLEFIDLLSVDVRRQAVVLLTPELCRRHYILPIEFVGDELTLAMVNPEDVIAIDDASSASGKAIRPVVATREAMGIALDRYVRLDEQIADLSTELSETAGEVTIVDTAEDIADDDDDAPIVRFVNLIISQAIQDRASDIHIDPTETKLRVRYRIDGVLHDTQEAPYAIKDGVISRLKIMSGIDIAEKRRPQDGRMSVRHNRREIDLRVATLPTVWGEKIVMRILDSSASKMQLEDLNMSDRNLEIFSESFSKPHGMLLVTGPTGSGKSTSLYTTLSKVARPEVNVITIEDPVEYRIDGVAQIQVNPRAGLTFGSALRSVLRGDPDVVLVGEIRDADTAQTSIEAALTGHLVLSTLHTNDAPSAVTRLIEMGIEPFLVASALEAVVAQRLARRLCTFCAHQVEPDRRMISSIGFELPLSGGQIGEPRGCKHCSGTGYRGRVALHEVMQVTEGVERLAVARASGHEIRKLAIEEGMVPLREDGWQKVLSGVTSIEEVLRVSA